MHSTNILTAAKQFFLRLQNDSKMIMCVETASKLVFLCLSFGAVKLQSKSDALPTERVLTQSHFKGILKLSFDLKLENDLSASKFSSAEKHRLID